MQKLIPAHSMRVLINKKTDEINKKIADLLESDSLCKLEYYLSEDTDTINGRFFSSDDIQLGNTFGVASLCKVECPLEFLNTIKLYKEDVDEIFKDININILTKYFADIFLNSIE